MLSLFYCVYKELCSFLVLFRIIYRIVMLVGYSSSIVRFLASTSYIKACEEGFGPFLIEFRD